MLTSNLEHWDAGIPGCEKAVAIESDNGLYHLWLGRIYGEKADRSGFLTAAGLAKKVRAEFERAVELSPNNWEARTDLAEFYLEAPAIVGGGKDKARAQAALMTPLNPAMAHWVIARIDEKNKDNAAAEQEYRAAIEASHGGARAWVNLAGFYRHTNRFDDMEKALRSMESSPLDRPAALVDGSGMLLRAGRDYPMAIRLVAPLPHVFHRRGSSRLQSPLSARRVARETRGPPSCRRRISRRLGHGPYLSPRTRGLKARGALAETSFSSRRSKLDGRSYAEITSLLRLVRCSGNDPSRKVADTVPEFAESLGRQIAEAISLSLRHR